MYTSFPIEMSDSDVIEDIAQKDGESKDPAQREPFISILARPTRIIRGSCGCFYSLFCGALFLRRA